MYPIEFSDSDGESLSQEEKSDLIERLRAAGTFDFDFDEESCPELWALLEKEEQ
jgi:hypothetical protein